MKYENRIDRLFIVLAIVGNTYYSAGDNNVQTYVLMYISSIFKTIEKQNFKFVFRSLDFYVEDVIYCCVNRVYYTVK